MNELLQKKIDRLNKAADNVVSATNQSQRDAAEKFLVQRANDLREEQQSLASWLDEADCYINEEMPAINSDASADYNRQWLSSLQDYESIQDALDCSYNKYMQALAAA